MAEAEQAGGYYIGADGNPHDAHGDRIEEQEVEPDEEGTALPDDFPARSKLADAGIETLEAVEAVEDLTEITGIGDATAGEIREAL